MGGDSEADQGYKGGYGTMTTQEMKNMIQGMDKYDLLSLARRGKESVMFDVVESFGSHVNPCWVWARAIEAAYARGLIDEQEQDWLNRKCG